MNKTALITGASSGIGKELATIHAEKGGDLILAARSETKLQALKKELEEKHGVSVTNLMPGATETGFEKRAGLDKTELFSQTANARSVAEDGYNAMLKGKIDVVSGLTFSQKIVFKLLPFMPKKTLLDMIFKMQSAVK